MTTTSIKNGVDTQALFAALDAVKSQPPAAKFQFRATNEWVNGTHSRSTIHDFFGLGTELSHREAHTFEADHPEVLTGKDHAPSPVEQLLHALAACITAGIGNIAAARGVELTRVESTVQGDIDLMGLLGLDPQVRNGYEQVEISIRIEGDAPAEKLRDIVGRSVARSAVFDVMTNATPVTVNVDV